MKNVLNIARYIYVKGLPMENDISIKIAASLRDNFGYDAYFIKTVTNIPLWAALLKPSLRARKKIIDQDNYQDRNHKIKIFFYKEKVLIFDKLGINGFISKKLSFLFDKRNLYENVKKIKPNLVHAHSLFPDGYYAMKISEYFGIPFGLTLRGTYSRLYENKTVCDTLAKAKFITTPSPNLYLALKQKINITLIPHYIEEIWFENAHNYISENLLTNIVTTCRIIEMKNIQIVLRSLFQYNKNRKTKLYYHIVGKGPYEGKLREMVAELGLQADVIFHGHLQKEEIITLYRKCGIFIMLSRPETLGRAFLEAAAQGLLIVGAQKTGCHGLLNNDSGYFIPETVESLVSVLKEVSVQSASEKIKKAKIIVQDLCSTNAVLSKYNELYEESTKDHIL